MKHLHHAVSNSCIMCGVSLIASSATDPRVNSCPGGPDTNVLAITHKIAERRLAKQMQYDRPFRYPPL